MILDEVLGGFKKSGIRSIDSLAESIGIDEKMVKEAIGRLETMGYLRGAAGTGHRSPGRGAPGARKKTCAGCSGSCAAWSVRIGMWELSERGKRYLQERKEGNDV